MENKDAPMYIGAYLVSSSTDAFWVGEMDNICLFDRVLTAKEVWGLYNTGRGTEKLKDLG